ncbi:hypothetical protein [Nitrincola sp. MINF-07-Sa-05]|uniref:hypothetical protein n=1 Tax=Nitrincola salilacus TaxID=3400273 RepID=UPI00391832D6
MNNLSLTKEQKNASQDLIESLQSMTQEELNRFTSIYAISEPAWHRFLKGAYNHPVTWWIGIFQLQMQMGVWGYQKKAAANAVGSTLWQITKPLRDEASTTGKDTILTVVKYNLKHRKSDISGRLVGAQFTNFASTGGRSGKRIPKGLKYPANLSNFILSSYGAAIKSVANGQNNLESVIQSILTGRSEKLQRLPQQSSDALSVDEEKLLNSSAMALVEVMALSQISPSPVPIREFCSRPENVTLKSICK